MCILYPGCCSAAVSRPLNYVPDSCVRRRRIAYRHRLRPVPPHAYTQNTHTRTHNGLVPRSRVRPCGGGGRKIAPRPWRSPNPPVRVTRAREQGSRGPGRNDTSSSRARVRLYLRNLCNYNEDLLLVLRCPLDRRPLPGGDAVEEYNASIPPAKTLARSREPAVDPNCLRRDVVRVLL